MFYRNFLASNVSKNQWIKTGEINSTSEPLQLVRIGGQNDPFEGPFRTANGDSYGNYVAYADKWVPGRSDFHLDDDGQIIPELSCGKKDEIYSICLLPIHLWVY